jgi:TolB protein
MKSGKAILVVCMLAFAVIGFGATWLLADILEGEGEGGAPSSTGDGIAVDIFGSTGGMPTVKKDPIAVPLFKNTGSGADRMGLAKQLADLTGDDMRMTGRFDVINRANYIENPHTAGVKPGTFNYEDWRLINAEFLIKGNFAFEGDKLIVQFRLYHVPTQNMLLGKEYSGKPDDWYLMVHKFGNDAVYELTRQQGIFGTKIAFVSRKGADTTLPTELYLIDVDGRNLKRLTFLQGKAMNPTWSPDGSQIVFAWENHRNPLDQENYLYSIPAAGGEPTMIFRAKGLILSPRFSPSGSRIAVAISYDGNMEIYAIPVKGGKPRRLTASRGIELFPAWSPRGDRVAFVSDRSGGPQIWTMKSDGTEVQRVSYHGSYNQSPDWAATEKGERIVYSARESGIYHIIMMAPDGTDATVITQGQGFGACEYPHFSPDGRAIALTTRAGEGRTIRLFNVDGSYTKQLTKVGVDDKNPAWSPRLLK